jgi:hypothetical protein
MLVSTAKGTRMLNIVKHAVTVGAIILFTGSAANADPANRHSGSECYLRGHRMFVPSGLNYPREAWANWGISCQRPNPQEVEGAEAAAGSGERPAEWCGWWMRQHLGGHFGPEYNAARNWLNAGRPLPGPLPGAIGVMEHHVFQVVRVIGPDQVLAISGNDHNAVRTRIRSTAKVIGWRDVGEIAGATSSAAPTQQHEGAVKESSTVNVQDGDEHLGSTQDGLAW